MAGLMELTLFYTCDFGGKNYRVTFQVNRLPLPYSMSCSVDIFHNEKNCNESLRNNTYTQKIYQCIDKETFTIELLLHGIVIAGGLYQVDTGHQDYILRSVCDRGTDLIQNFLDEEDFNYLICEREDAAEDMYQLEQDMMREQM